MKIGFSRPSGKWASGGFTFKFPSGQHGSLIFLTCEKRKDSTGAMPLSDFEPSRAIENIRRIPRFGHSRNVALLTSSETAEDYQDGVVAFSVCILTMALIWTIVLLVLKFYYGLDRVGCAAGGEVIEVRELKKVYNLDKFERKERILRNWRVQTACLVACVVLLPFTILMLRLGLNPFISSLADIQEINDQVDSHSYRGIQIAAQLQDSSTSLSNIKQSGLLQSTLTLDELCPNRITNFDNNSTTVASNNDTSDLTSLLGFDPNLVQEQIVSNIDEIEAIIAQYDLPSAVNILYQVTNATSEIDGAIDSLKSKDWIVKLFVVILDVVVLYLLAGILIVKDNTDYPAYQFFTSWLLLPIFCAMLAATIAGTCIFASIAIFNADFCAGGDGMESPIGTIREIIVLFGYNNESFTYRALDYYADDCLTENPLSFLSVVEGTVFDARSKISTLYDNLNSDSLTTINDECGFDNNIPTANLTLYSLQQHLMNLEGTVASVIDVTSCSSISPIFRRFLFGSTCTESVEGLAWLYSSLLFITIFGFIVLSTRAAFYNPVIRGRRNKRREKEFLDYKEFMSQYYDTSDWELDFVPEIPNTLHSCNTEDSRSSSGVSPLDTYGKNGEESIASESRGLDAVSTLHSEVEGSVANNTFPGAPMQRNASSDDDSYDSTYSVDVGDEHSVTSRSVFSLFLKRRMEAVHQRESSDLGGEASHDDIVSVSSSSILNRLMGRRNVVRGEASIYDTDPLSLNPSKTAQPHPYDHRINSHDDDNDSYFDNDENDSSAGIILSPPAAQFSVQSTSPVQNLYRRKQRLLPQCSEDDMSDSSLALEMQPLSPSSVESLSNILGIDSPTKTDAKVKISRWPFFR